MVTDSQVRDVEKIQKLLAKPDEWTDAEIEELRTLLKHVGIAGTIIRDIAQLRSNLEVIVAVRKFDKTSTELIQTTNTLTKRIFWLTIAAVVLGVVQIFMTLFRGN